MKKLSDFLSRENIFWDKIIEFLREQRLLLVLFVIIIGVFVFGLQKIIIPSFEKLVFLKKELIRINERLFVLQKQLISHPNIQKEIQFLTQKYQEIEKEFPPERMFLSLTQKVLSWLENEEIKIINFKYLYDLKQGVVPGFKKYGLDLEVMTDYVKLGKFLEAMEKSGLKFCVEQLKITKLSDRELNAKLRLDFILRKEK